MGTARFSSVPFEAPCGGCCVLRARWRWFLLRGWGCAWAKSVSRLVVVPLASGVLGCDVSCHVGRSRRHNMESPSMLWAWRQAASSDARSVSCPMAWYTIAVLVPSLSVPLGGALHGVAGAAMPLGL